MKKQLMAIATFMAGMAFASAALAQVTVTAPWIRGTVPQAKSTGAFMQLTSKQDARLVEVRADGVATAQIHKMEMAGDMMKMQAVTGLDLAAGKTVDLASGGYHIMLMNLTRQLKEGDSVGVTLVFESKDKKRETVNVSVPVKALTYMPAGMAH